MAADSYLDSLRKTLYKHARKVLLFAGFGVLLSGLSVLFTWLAESFLGWYYFTVYAVVEFVVVVLKFVINRSVIFDASDQVWWQAVLYALSYVAFYLGNLSLVYVLESIFGLYYVLAILISLGIIFISKYVLYDKVIFR